MSNDRARFGKPRMVKPTPPVKAKMDAAESSDLQVRIALFVLTEEVVAAMATGVER